MLSAIRTAAATQHEPTIQPLIASPQRVELDEMWSFVHSKSHQQWLWYAFERNRKQVLAFVADQRTDAACETLVQKLTPIHMGIYYTDRWASYAKYLPASAHIMSKRETQQIERNNLSIRTHLKRFHRKTICFSKNTQMHYAVLKLYFNGRI